MLKTRTKIPLAELMDLLLEAKSYLPILKVLPQKVDKVECELHDLRDLLFKKFVTHQ